MSGLLIIETKMKIEEFIRRYGEDAYKKKLEQGRAWYEAHKEEIREKYEAHPEEKKAATKKRLDAHPEYVKAKNHEGSRKGGKYYEKNLKYKTTGIPGERHKIRKKHAAQYRPFKKIIAPDSQIHHEWVPKTAEYRGLALVEANPHRYGIIDVIEILDGEITLLTEEDVKKGMKTR